MDALGSVGPWSSEGDLDVDSLLVLGASHALTARQVRQERLPPPALHFVTGE
jgi:hypothetical protein